VRRQFDVVGGIHDALANVVLLNPVERRFCFALKVDIIEISGGFCSGNLGLVRPCGCLQNKHESKRQNRSNGKPNSSHREKYSLGFSLRY